MKKSKLLISALSVLLVLILALGVFAACDKDKVPPAGDKYVLTFEMGGSTAAKTVEVNKGDALTAEQVPAYTGDVPSGQEFDAWYVKSVGGDATATGVGDKLTVPYTPVADVVFEARFKPATPGVTTHTVTFDVNGTAVSTLTVNHGATLTAEQIPAFTGSAPAGQHFVAWVVEGTSTRVEAGYTVNGNVKAVPLFANDPTPGKYSTSYEDYIGYFECYDDLQEYYITMEVTAEGLVYTNYEEYTVARADIVADDENGGFTFTYTDDFDDEVTMWMYLDTDGLHVGEADGNVEYFDVLERTEKTYKVTVVYINEEDMYPVDIYKVTPGGTLSTLQIEEINEYLTALAEEEGLAVDGGWFDENDDPIDNLATYQVNADVIIYINMVSAEEGEVFPEGATDDSGDLPTLTTDQLFGNHEIDVTASNNQWYYTVTFDTAFDLTGEITSTYGVLKLKGGDVAYYQGWESGSSASTITFAAGTYTVLIDNEGYGTTDVAWSITAEEKVVGDFPAGGTSSDNAVSITLDQLKGDHVASIENTNGRAYYSLRLTKAYTLTLDLTSETGSLTFVGVYTDSDSSVLFRALASDSAPVSHTLEAGTYTILLNTLTESKGNVSFTVAAEVVPVDPEVSNKFVGIWSDRDEVKYHQAFIDLGEGELLVTYLPDSYAYYHLNATPAVYNAETGELTADASETGNHYVFKIVDDKLQITFNDGAPVTLSKVTETSKYEGTYYAVNTNSDGIYKIIVEKGGFIRTLQLGSTSETYYARVYDNSGTVTLEYRSSYSSSSATELKPTGDSSTFDVDAKGNFVYTTSSGIAYIYVKVDDAADEPAIYRCDGSAPLYDFTVGGQHVYIVRAQKAAASVATQSYATVAAVADEDDVYTLKYQDGNNQVDIVVKLNAAENSYQIAKPERGKFTGDDGLLFIDGFKDGKATLNNVEVDYTYLSGSGIVQINGKNYKLDFDNSQYTVLSTEQDGYQGVWVESSSTRITLDGFGGILYDSGSSTHYEGTYTISDKDGTPVLTVTFADYSYYSGEFTLVNHGYTLRHTHGDFTVAALFDSDVQGSYLYDNKLVFTVLTHWFVASSTTQDATVFVASDAKLVDGAKTYTVSGTQYTLTVGADVYTVIIDGEGVKVNGQLVDKMALPLEAKTYYANHNRWTLDVAASTLKQVDDTMARAITNFNFYYESGKLYYTFKTNAGYSSEKTWQVYAADDSGYMLSDGTTAAKLADEQEETKTLYGIWAKTGNDTIKLTFNSLTTLDIEGGSNAGTSVAYSKGAFTVNGVKHSFAVHGSALIVTADEETDYTGEYTQTGAVEMDWFPEDWVGTWVNSTNDELKFTRKTVQYKAHNSEDWVNASMIELHDATSTRDFYITINGVRFEIYSMSSNPTSLTVSGGGTTIKGPFTRKLFDDSFVGNWQTEDGNVFISITMSTIHYSTPTTERVQGTNVVEAEAGVKYTFDVDDSHYYVALVGGELKFSAQDPVSEQKLVERVADATWKDAKFTFATVLSSGWSSENVVMALKFDGLGGVVYWNRNGDTETGTSYYNGYYYFDAEGKLNIYSCNATVNGKWDVISGGYQLQKDSAVYSKPAKFDFVGYYTGSDSSATYVLSVTAYGFTLSTSTGDNGTTYDITVGGDTSNEYNFTINEHPYKLTVGDGTYTLGGASLTPITATSVSNGTYYAYHNVFSVTVNGLTVTSFRNKLVSTSVKSNTVAIAVSLEGTTLKYTFVINDGGEITYELKNAEGKNQIVYKGVAYDLATEAEADRTAQVGKYVNGQYTLTVNGIKAPYSATITGPAEASYSFTISATTSSVGSATINDKSYRYMFTGNAYVLEATDGGDLGGAYVFSEEVEVVFDTYKPWRGVWTAKADGKVAVCIVGDHDIWLCVSADDVKDVSKYEKGVFVRVGSSDYDWYFNFSIGEVNFWADDNPRVYTPSAWSTSFDKVSDYSGENTPEAYVAWLNQQA